MAGRSIMVAFALGAMALAVSAGYAGPTDLAVEPYLATDTSSVHAITPSISTLSMVLATDNVAEGPTPVVVIPDTSDDSALRGLTTEPEDQNQTVFSLASGPSTTASYGPSTGLLGLPGGGEWRPLEFSIAGAAASGFDFQMARRFGSNENINGGATTAGAEVRIGQRLKSVAHEFQSPTSWRHPAWYVFAASDGQALIYTPSNDPFSQNHNFTTEDRVNIGSVTAGVSVEAHGMQASFAYVKRKITTLDMIREHQERDQSFTGLTLTKRW